MGVWISLGQSTYQPKTPITAIDYTAKWVEAQGLKDTTFKLTTKFLFEEIVTKFGCSLEFVNDQKNHFIEDTIKYSHKTLSFSTKNQQLTIHKLMGRLKPCLDV